MNALSHGFYAWQVGCGPKSKTWATQQELKVQLEITHRIMREEHSWNAGLESFNYEAEDANITQDSENNSYENKTGIHNFMGNGFN